MKAQTENWIIIFHTLAIIFFTIGFPYLATRQGLDAHTMWLNALRFVGSAAAFFAIAYIHLKNQQSKRTEVTA